MSEIGLSLLASLPPFFLPSSLLAHALCEVAVSEPYWFQKEFGSHHFFVIQSGLLGV